jgi:hypothetical protein
LILGLDTDGIEAVRQNLFGAIEHVFSPFTLMKIFLELEKKKRFGNVADTILRFLTLIEDGKRTPVNADTKADPVDPHRFVKLYVELSYLKEGLTAWKAQLRGMKRFIRELQAGPEVQEINPDDYLIRLINEYEVHVQRCKMALLTTSLAFQKVRDCEMITLLS